jgi:hypothetical protein
MGYTASTPSPTRSAKSRQYRHLPAIVAAVNAFVRGELLRLWRPMGLRHRTIVTVSLAGPRPLTCIVAPSWMSEYVRSSTGAATTDIPRDGGGSMVRLGSPLRRRATWCRPRRSHRSVASARLSHDWVVDILQSSSPPRDSAASTVEVSLGVERLMFAQRSSAGRRRTP